MRVRMPARARNVVTAAALTAVAAAAASVPGTPWHHVPLLVFGVLAALQAIIVVTADLPLLSESQSASASVAILLTAVILLPPGAAVAVGAVGALFLVFRRVPTARLVFVIACSVIAPAAGSAVYQALHGSRTLVTMDFPRALPPIGAATLALAAVPALMTAALSVAGGVVGWKSALCDLLRGSFPRNLAYGFVGLLSAVLWDNRYPVMSALVLIGPLRTTHWAVAQYIGQRAAHDATIRALVQAVEIKDLYTRGHSERVAKVSELIARRLALSEDRIAILCYAAILHDVGKLGVPTRLLRKTGPLDAEEAAAIRLHPVRGVDAVRDIAFLNEAYAAILHHHERMDGLGYPSGLAGERIPKFARIIAVADAFDSMTSTRSYRAARPVEEALDELRLCAGTQFDPTIVNALEVAMREAVARGEPWTGDGTMPGSGSGSVLGTVLVPVPEAGEYARDGYGCDNYSCDGYGRDGYGRDDDGRDSYGRDDYDHDDPAFTVPSRAVVSLPADRQTPG
ncbi:MAG TPA: HD-GYP domain-containing protein [Actinocrinis sp.]|uniref:HD-GYP domain-containing protein n=1 Tax=Actinocrinis sp. TaxID=1920516 RepID=UPI002DDCE667|nr:HD-GYP domain-containing protein [Actinocrinis sp.]HEV3173187.1 HD-GYP domain-containing protein [Actinocrinis sp.]